MADLRITPPDILWRVRHAVSFGELRQHMDRRRTHFIRRAAGYVRRVAKSLILRKGAARARPKQFRKPPKRKFRKDGRTWTAAYRRWRESPETKAYLKWQQEVRTRPTAPRGQPPYTHTGALRKSLAYGVSARQGRAWIGPARSKISDVGRVHEHGGRRRRKRYPRRPFMRPAMQKARPQFARFWQETG